MSKSVIFYVFHIAETIHEPGTAAAHYLCSPTESCIIPKSNKLHTSEEEQITNQNYVDIAAVKLIESGSDSML